MLMYHDFLLLYSVFSEVFSQVGELSGLLPGKKIHHQNHPGVNQLRAQWDPTSDECFIVGSLDEPRQVCLHLVISLLVFQSCIAN